jgi:hypothetical protein
MLRKPVPLGLEAPGPSGSWAIGLASIAPPEDSFTRDPAPAARPGGVRPSRPQPADRERHVAVLPTSKPANPERYAGTGGQSQEYSRIIRDRPRGPAPWQQYPNSRESLTRAHARRLAVYGPFIPGPSGHATVTSRVVVGVDPRGRMAGIATWCGDTYLGHELVVRHGRGIIPDSAYLHQVCERIACWLAALPEGQVLLAAEGVHEPGRPARRRRKGTEGGLRYHRALAPNRDLEALHRPATVALTG